MRWLVVLAFALVVIAERRLSVLSPRVARALARLRIGPVVRVPEPTRPGASGRGPASYRSAPESPVPLEHLLAETSTLSADVELRRFPGTTTWILERRDRRRRTCTLIELHRVHGALELRARLLLPLVWTILIPIGLATVTNASPWVVALSIPWIAVLAFAISAGRWSEWEHDVRIGLAEIERQLDSLHEPIDSSTDD